MKKYLCVLIGTISMFKIYAHNIDYNPFAEEGKVWNMLYNNEEDILTPGYEFCYFIKGDTTISDLTCKKLYVYNEGNKKQRVYKMAFYEDENKGRVYFIPVGSTEKHLLYDFRIPEGASSIMSDAIHPDWDIVMKNNKDLFVETNGRNRHCLLVNRVNTFSGERPSGWWIEGIGSELGPLNTWLFEAMGNCSFLLNCEVNGQLIFSMSDYMEKTTGVTEINKGDDLKNALNAAIYDLQGRKMVGGVMKGITIQNGKKTLHR